MTDSPKFGAREVASQPAKQEFRELLLARKAGRAAAKTKATKPRRKVR
jgi:hypothetical protein